MTPLLRAFLLSTAVPAVAATLLLLGHAPATAGDPVLMLVLVALGGGTGLSTLLRGLKDLVARRRDEVADEHRPIAGLTALSSNARFIAS